MADNVAGLQPLNYTTDTPIVLECKVIKADVTPPGNKDIPAVTPTSGGGSGGSGSSSGGSGSSSDGSGITTVPPDTSGSTTPKTGDFLFSSPLLLAILVALVAASISRAIEVRG